MDTKPLTRSEMRILAARVFDRSFDDFCVWAAETVRAKCPDLASELVQMRVITNFGQAFAVIRCHRRVPLVSSALLNKARVEGTSVKDLNRWEELPGIWDEDASSCQSSEDEDGDEDGDENEEEDEKARENREWEDDSDLVYEGEEDIFASRD